MASSREYLLHPARPRRPRRTEEPTSKAEALEVGVVARSLTHPITRRQSVELGAEAPRANESPPARWSGWHRAPPEGSVRCSHAPYRFAGRDSIGAEASTSSRSTHRNTLCRALRSTPKSRSSSSTTNHRSDWLQTMLELRGPPKQAVELEAKNRSSCRCDPSPTNRLRSRGHGDEMPAASRGSISRDCHRPRSAFVPRGRGPLSRRRCSKSGDRC